MLIQIYGLCFSDDMKLLLATSRDCNASIWDIPDSGAAWPTSPRVVLSGHTRTITGGAFLGDASHVVTSSLDASLRVWRVDDGSQTFRRKMCNPVRAYMRDCAADLVVYRFAHCRATASLVWSRRRFGKGPWSCGRHLVSRKKTMEK